MLKGSPFLVSDTGDKYFRTPHPKVIGILGRQYVWNTDRLTKEQWKMVRPLNDIEQPQENEYERLYNEFFSPEARFRGS